ncbi:pyridoxamine 5'-phosphate oxidase family protein [Pseudophaeobacter sp. 1A16562]|uniref:pyridoxamine 5'-phosphate oxidase family protein n=1 Tax=Pseudophaeobacter sp. 1A16562 TaxID=3098143 RepID=UPI0034D759FB
MSSSVSNVFSPFHEGEQEMQRRTGKRAAMEVFGRRVIRPFMPDQHREFYAQLPFIAAGAVDAEGWPWATLLTGAPGFIRSPDAEHLTISLSAAEGDPVHSELRTGARLGLLGIELHSRRRNRVNGRIASLSEKALTLKVDQSFGNCPQYIQLRQLEAADIRDARRQSEPIKDLQGRVRSLIEAADTFFVSSHIPPGDTPEREGVDVSHRGGRPGFIHVEGNTLTIPEFPGNNYYNTLGNFLLNPRAGLLIPDFATGTLLQLTGTVELLEADDPVISSFQGAQRGWQFTFHQGLWTENALPFRAGQGAFSPNTLLTDTWTDADAREKAEEHRNAWRAFRVSRIEDESAEIRSFYLEPADGLPLLPFEAGQFLTLRVPLPGEDTPLLRTYTVSSAPGEPFYRISVKKEEQGRVSRHLHEKIQTGHQLEAKAPRGGFTLDASATRPAVLIAGGVGITPMVAMVRHALREGLRTRHRRQITVLHSARNTKVQAFARELDELAQASGGQIRYLPLVSEKPAKGAAKGPAWKTGVIDDDILRQALWLDDFDFHLCGPEGFMQAIYDSLLTLGVPDNRIFAEAFGPSSLVRKKATAPQPVEPAAEQAVVRFAKSGFEMPWQPEDGSLLEMAEAHGLTPEFSCRSGTCGMCSTRLKSGTTTYTTDPSITPPPGETLLCCSVPAKGSDTIELDL